MPGEILIIQGIQQTMAGETGRWLSVFFARYLVFIFALFVAYIGFGKKRRHLRVIAYEATWAALIALIVATVLGQLIGRTRPFLVDPSIIALIPVPLTEHSFPSGHTATSFAAATVLLFGNPIVGLLALAAATLVGFGRIAAGVHYPTDVLAGALLGIIIGLLVHFIRLRRAKKKGEPYAKSG